MKKTLLIITILAISFIATGSNYANASEIAVVNLQKIMQESSASKSARSQLKAKKQEFQKQISKLEASLQKQDKELAQQKAVLSKDEFSKKLVTFRKKAANAQKDVQAKRAKLNKAFEESLSKIQKSIISIVSKLSKEKGFKIAVSSSQAIYVSNELDISNEVLKRLNKELPKLNVKF